MNLIIYPMPLIIYLDYKLNIRLNFENNVNIMLYNIEKEKLRNHNRNNYYIQQKKEANKCFREVKS